MKEFSFRTGRNAEAGQLVKRFHYSRRVPANVLPGVDIQPHFDNGKYLYWRALNRAGEAMAKRLQLDVKPYPRPDEQKAAA